MWFFKKRKKEDTVSTSDKVARKIAGVGIKAQQTFSENMNKLFARLSPRSVKVFFVVFCLSAGGYSLFLIGDSLFHHPDPSQVIQVEPVKAPKHFDQAGDETLRSDQYVDEETYRSIITFKIYMDSLRVANRNVFDSIQAVRPGLMDSVLVLESIYNSQIK